MRLAKKDVDAFLRDRSLADTTKDYYGYILGEFLRSGRDFGRDGVQSFLNKQYPHGPSQNTGRQVLRSLAKWMRQRIPPIGEERLMRRFELEQIEGLEGVKVTHRFVRKEVPEDELRRIFAGMDRGSTGFSGIWCLFYYGCRPIELAGLEPKMIGPRRYRLGGSGEILELADNEVVFDTAKTKVQRKLYFDEFTGGHLRRFVGSGLGYQFLYRSAKGLGIIPKAGRRTFETRMQRELSKAGFHSVRLDLLVKYIMGHTVGDIASVYTDYDQDVRRAMLDHHYLKPLEKELS